METPQVMRHAYPAGVNRHEIEEMTIPVSEDFSMKSQIFRQKVAIIAVFGASLLFGSTTFAQIPPPARCEFTKAFAVLGESVGNGKRFLQDRKDSDVYRFYNDDGTVWYEVAISENNPKYFERNDNPDYRPIYPFTVAGPELRLIGECDYWYQVVVNEAKETVKYVPKSDPLFDKFDWEETIMTSAGVMTDLADNPIRSAPDGPVADDLPDGVKYFQPVVIKGEWMLVSGASEPDRIRFSGWIRWRNGDDLLIKYRVPARYANKWSEKPTK